MEENRDMDIIRNLRTIEWLKSEILVTIRSLSIAFQGKII